VAAQLRANLGEQLLAVAYNEFCAPTLEESVEELIKKGRDSHYRDHDDVYAWRVALGG
jgi:sirohydrochlorin ferrochelatase